MFPSPEYSDIPGRLCSMLTVRAYCGYGRLTAPRPGTGPCRSSARRWRRRMIVHPATMGGGRIETRRRVAYGSRFGHPRNSGCHGGIVRRRWHNMALELGHALSSRDRYHGTVVRSPTSIDIYCLEKSLQREGVRAAVARSTACPVPNSIHHFTASKFPGKTLVISAQTLDL